MLTLERRLTNLGVLWLGDAGQRNRLTYPVTVQYIVYDNQEQKVRKVDWHDNTLNPEQLLLEIEEEATELRYSYDVQVGLFRRAIHHYNPKVLRELLINAFAHKSYTISGDIVIAVIKSGQSAFRRDKRQHTASSKFVSEKSDSVRACGHKRKACCHRPHKVVAID